MKSLIKQYSLPLISISLVLSVFALIVIKSRYPVRNSEILVVKNVIYQGMGNSVIEDENGEFLSLKGKAEIGDKIEIDCQVVEKRRSNCLITNHGH